MAFDVLPRFDAFVFKGTNSNNTNDKNIDINRCILRGLNASFSICISRKSSLLSLRRALGLFLFIAFDLQINCIEFLGAS